METHFLDFETTGLDPANNAVVEVALRGPRPYHGWVSDAGSSEEKALALHGWSEPWLAEQGQPGAQVLEALLANLGTNPVRVVAHQAAFEQTFLEAWAERTGHRLPPITWSCTYRMAKEVFGDDWQGFSLGALAQAHGWDHSPLHRADEDVRVTERLYEALLAWASLKGEFQETSPVIYLAGPLRGDGLAETISTNQERMKGIARLVQAVLPRAALIVPHTNFLYLDEAGPKGLAFRAQILKACEALVSRCDALLVSASYLTEGVRREMTEARRKGLPIHFIPAFDAAGLAIASQAC